MFNDELLVRGPSGMQPTPRALEIGRGVHLALEQLHTALAPADFDPRTTTRRFSLISGLYAAAVLVPGIAQRMAQSAPGAELAVDEFDPDLLERLDSHQVDFMIAGVVSGPERFGYDLLIREELVWVAAADSPLAQRRKVTLEALVETPHIVVARQPFASALDNLARRGLTMRRSWEDAGAFDAALAARGLTRRVAVTVPDALSAMAVARRSHMATLIPRRLALALAERSRLVLIPPPYASPPVEIGLIYLRDRVRDPAMAWMRETIIDVVAEL
jgi:DNA-binding transcriptional LysR family regulator